MFSVVRRHAASTAAVLFLAALVCTGCRSGPRADKDPTRVVLVSYDGLGADMAWSWIEEGLAADPEGLSAIARDGLAVGRVRMVDPTLTAVNMVAIATGRKPVNTGVVGSYFHRPGSPIDQVESAFDVPLGATPVWVAAHRAGRRTGVLVWAGCDNASDQRRADFGITWPETPLAPSALVELGPEQAEPTSDLPSEDGVPGLLWRLEIPTSGAQPDPFAWQVAAVDVTPDGRPRYDTLAVRARPADSWTFVGEREWFAVSGHARAVGEVDQRRYGAWCKALQLDRHRGLLRLYRGAAYRLQAYPEDFAARLDETVGFWPGPPDNSMLEAWWLDANQGIDLDTYLEQVERLDRYLDRMAAAVVKSESFRLLMAYHPTLDAYLHASLITDPRQWAYSPGRALAAREGLKRVARSIDRSVGDLWRALDPSRDVLAVVSDHGFVPLHDRVNVNRALADVGLVEVEREGSVARVAATSPMFAVPYGGVAHLYLNLRGRERSGVVELDQGAELLRRAARALADLEVEGRPVVERTLTRFEARAIGLDHPSSGDLIVFFMPGFEGGDGLGDEVVVPSRSYGQHGYLSHHDALCGVFFARGAAVSRTRIDELPVTDIAPAVTGWLGFAFPQGSGRKPR